jgi:hypothetical protein
MVMAASLLTFCGTMMGTQPPDRQYTIANDPPVLALIRTADEVYVFPVPTPRKPRLDKKHLRLLDTEGMRKIVRLLGNQRNWWWGGWSLVLPDNPARDIGLLFRRDGNELVLVCDGSLVQGTFNGEGTLGLLANERQANKFEDWKRRYAHLELSGQ